MNVQVFSLPGINDAASTYFVVLAVAAITFFLVRRALVGRFGRTLQAVRDLGQLTGSLGVSALRYRLVAFGLSGFVAAVAGTLYAQLQTFIFPAMFQMNLLVPMLVMVFVGGAGSLWGPLIGAAFAIVLIEFFQDLGDAQAIAYGIVLMVAIALLPGGLTSLFPHDRRLPVRSTPALAADLDGGGGMTATAPETTPRHAAGTPVVEFTGVGKSFGGNSVLEDVTLAVRPGFTGLIGPNGAGKTTCLNVVSGYLQPDAGDVMLRGVSVLGLSPSQVARRGVSRTFQTPRLIPNLSAVENVMVGGSRHYRHGHLAELFGLPSARRDEREQRERAYAVLATLSLNTHADRPANSYPIGSQKIIEVGRALLNDPALLMLDEPAAGLGAEDVDHLVQGLDDWTSEQPDAAVLIIEHDLELITRLCPTVAVLHFGRIIQAGAPKDVLRDPVVVEAYLGADFAAGD